MAARLKLTVDWFNKTLIRSSTSQTPFILPSFFQGDIVPFQVTIVEPDPDGSINDYLKPDISNMALKLAVGAQPVGTAGTPTPFVTQFTWSKNTQESFFYADVAFNTGDLDTWLGSNSSKEAYIELEITELSAVTTIYQGTVTIKAELIEGTTASVQPGETALSLEAARQMFCPRMLEPGGQLIFPSLDGTKRTVLYTDDDGSWHEDTL